MVQKALHESREMHRMLVSAPPDTVFVFDLNGTTRCASDSAVTDRSS